MFLDYTNFITVFSTTTGISLLAFLYAGFILERPRRENIKANKISANEKQLSERFKILPTNISRAVTHSIKCTFKKRDGNQRLQVIICIGIVLGNMMTTKGKFTDT